MVVADTPLITRPLRFDISSLERALYDEHCWHSAVPGGERNNTCEIEWAYEQGLYLFAAHMLVGATECPQTEAALQQAMDFYGETWQAELDAERALVTHLWRCPACNACIYGDDEQGITVCSNCLYERRAEHAVELLIDGVSYYLTSDVKAAQRWATEDEAAAVVDAIEVQKTWPEQVWEVTD